ncbi:MAG: formate dehydrogenase accessory sulfurtransferase FdhD [Euryarchaeota archaeon]|nr:formate dehydrogenase accessory sulfurtransferase FdhD [Euryarchaeota archaeon]
MSQEATKSTPIQLWIEGDISSSQETLVSEYALQIVMKIGGVEKPLSILLRTPGDDVVLVIGWLLGEAIIESLQEIVDITYFDDQIVIELDEKKHSLDTLAARRFAISSSCGLCGRETLDGLEIPSRLSLSSDSWVSAETVSQLPSKLVNAQSLFESTGGLHASALFDADGELIEIREDVGRHNALDKLIGARLQANSLPAEKQILLLSGRIGYELIQKAAFAGIPVIAGLGAPSTMAVEAARAAGLTLIGFLKPSRFNIYTGSWRLFE